MSKNQLTLIGLTMLAIAVMGGWWLTKEQPLEPAVVLPDVVQPATQQKLKHQQRLMDVQIKQLNQQQLALQQQRLKTDRASAEHPQLQRDVSNRIANLPEPDSLRGTVPSDVSGRRISGQDTPSGVPVTVLKDYQQETGISPERIEELMNRDK